jgi:hypothetical protein
VICSDARERKCCVREYLAGICLERRDEFAIFPGNVHLMQLAEGFCHARSHHRVDDPQNAQSAFGSCSCD